MATSSSRSQSQYPIIDHTRHYSKYERLMFAVSHYYADFYAHTPRSIHNLYVEGLATITSNSPRSVKQRALFTKLKMSAEKTAARAAMHEAGEEHLRNEIKHHRQKAKPDTRRLNLNSGEACVLERGEILVDLKRKRDEADAKKAEKAARKAKSSTTEVVIEA